MTEEKLFRVTIWTERGKTYLVNARSTAEIKAAVEACEDEEITLMMVERT